MVMSRATNEKGNRKEKTMEATITGKTPSGTAYTASLASDGLFAIEARGKKMAMRFFEKGIRSFRGDGFVGGDVIIPATPDVSRWAKSQLAAHELAQFVARFAAQFAEARETGRDVMITERKSSCDHSVAECSLDIIREYAKPDGTVRVERVHTH